jgi:RNA polymerase sigma factor (TIGR02999 family)
LGNLPGALLRTAARGDAAGLPPRHPAHDNAHPMPDPDRPPPGDFAPPLTPDDVGAMYDEIRRIARSLMRGERVDHTLAPTALANEAYLRLLGGGKAGSPGDGEFLAAAVTTLRRILVEHGRRRARLKRGGNVARVPVDTDELPAKAAADDLIAVDEALQRLATFDAKKAQLVELRFFGGLGVDEAAQILGLSPRTAARDWLVARAFLRAELGGRDGEDGGDDVDA